MYGNAMMYEIFIRRAFNCNRGMRHGAEVGIMENFMNCELTPNKMLPPLDKQREQIRTYIDKAIEKFMKRKPTIEERSELVILQSLNESAYSSKDFMNVIDKALDITQRFKEG